MSQHYEAKKHLLWITCLIIAFALIALCILLCVGIHISHRQGFPTLSRMLNDSQIFTICFATILFIWGLTSIISTIAYTLFDANHRKYYSLALIAAFFGTMRVLFMILVTLVPIDYNVSAHMAVAGTAIGTSCLRELFMAIWRSCTFTWPYRWIMPVNWLMLVVLFGLTVAFAAVIMINGPEELETAVLEYLIIVIILFLPAWQLLDIQRDMNYCSCKVG